MSPTEDDLRTALSDGVGDTPDLEHIVFVARETRARRRRKLLSAAAAVIVVGGVATGGTFLAQHSGSTESAGNSVETSGGGGGTNGSDQKASTGGVIVPSVVRPSAASATRTASGTTAASGQSTTCPTGATNTLLPGGGGTTQFGSTGALFSQPVSTVTVCAVPTVASSGGSTHVTLTGSDATTFAASLENAPKTRPTGACEQYRTTDQAALSIIATTASGTMLPTVTTTINEPVCAVVVTNGTAVRYDWSWPASLGTQLAHLRAAVSPGH